MRDRPWARLLLLLAACSHHRPVVEPASGFGNDADVPEPVLPEATNRACPDLEVPEDGCLTLATHEGHFLSPDRTDTIALEECEISAKEQSEGMVERSMRADLVLVDQEGKEWRADIGDWTNGWEWGGKFELWDTLRLPTGRDVLAVMTSSYGEADGLQGTSSRVLILAMDGCTAELLWEGRGNAVEVSLAGDDDGDGYWVTLYDFVEADEGQEIPDDLVRYQGDVARATVWKVTPQDDTVIAVPDPAEPADGP